MPHWIGVLSINSLFDLDSKKFDNASDYYKEKPDFPSDFRDEDGNKLRDDEVQYLSAKLELYDLSKPYQTASIKQWTKEVTDFKFRELLKSNNQSGFF